MNGVEELVRETLLAQVHQPPPMTDPAGAALERTHAVRRRRWTSLVTAVTAVALTATIGWLATVRSGGDDHPSRPAPATGTPSARPDASQRPTGAASTAAAAPTASGRTPAGDRGAIIYDGTVLVLPDGRMISLAAIPGGVAEAYLGRDGWLLSGRGEKGGFPGGGQSLWLLRPDGQLLPLLERLDTVAAVAADGRRLAWRRDGRVSIGHLTSAGTVVTLVTDRSTEIPDHIFPYAVVADTVILADPGTGGGLGYDVWRSDRGRYVPAWERMRHVSNVFDASPDGRWLLGMVIQSNGTQAETCLARLDPTAELRATATVCAGFPLSSSNRAAVSPDGRWLVLPSLGVDGPPHLTVFDLSTMFTKRKITQIWRAVEDPGQWVDSTTMIAVGEDGTPVRLRLGSADAEPLPLPSGLPPALPKTPLSLPRYRAVATLPGLG